MWSEGTIGIPGRKSICHYWVKHYDEPSEEFGIDGGRISKLMIKIDGRIAANYDRGWDMKPVDEDVRLACGILLKEYN